MFGLLLIITSIIIYKRSVQSRVPLRPNEFSKIYPRAFNSWQVTTVYMDKPVCNEMENFS
jgi:hypothetical protein